MVPTALYLMRNTHLDPIAFWLGGSDVKVSAIFLISIDILHPLLPPLFSVFPVKNFTKCLRIVGKEYVRLELCNFDLHRPRARLYFEDLRTRMSTIISLGLLLYLCTSNIGDNLFEIPFVSLPLVLPFINGIILTYLVFFTGLSKMTSWLFKSRRAKDLKRR